MVTFADPYARIGRAMRAMRRPVAQDQDALYRNYSADRDPYNRTWKPTPYEPRQAEVEQVAEDLGVDLDTARQIIRDVSSGGGDDQSGWQEEGFAISRTYSNALSQSPLLANIFETFTKINNPESWSKPQPAAVTPAPAPRNEPAPVAPSVPRGAPQEQERAEQEQALQAVGRMLGEEQMGLEALANEQAAQLAQDMQQMTPEDVASYQSMMDENARMSAIEQSQEAARAAMENQARLDAMFTQEESLLGPQRAPAAPPAPEPSRLAQFSPNVSLRAPVDVAPAVNVASVRQNNIAEMLAEREAQRNAAINAAINAPLAAPTFDLEATRATEIGIEDDPQAALEAEMAAQLEQDMQGILGAEMAGARQQEARALEAQAIAESMAQNEQGMAQRELSNYNEAPQTITPPAPVEAMRSFNPATYAEPNMPSPVSPADRARAVAEAERAEINALTAAMTQNERGIAAPNVSYASWNDFDPALDGAPGATPARGQPAGLADLNDVTDVSEIDVPGPAMSLGELAAAIAASQEMDDTPPSFQNEMESLNDVQSNPPAVSLAPPSIVANQNPVQELEQALAPQAAVRTTRTASLAPITMPAAPQSSPISPLTGNYNDFVPSPTVTRSLDPLGQVSANYESSGKGVGFISHGRGDPGGQSYGVHQLSSAYSMGAFLRSKEGAKYANAFAGLRPGTREFNNVYRNVVAQDPKGMQEAQYNFYARTHYQPVLEMARKAGFNVNDRGIQEALFSQAIQHSGRGNQSIIGSAARRGVGKTAEEQIQQLYNARANYVSQVRLPANWQQGVQSRYRREVEDAKRASREARSTGTDDGLDATSSALGGYTGAQPLGQQRAGLGSFPSLTAMGLALASLNPLGISTAQAAQPQSQAEQFAPLPPSVSAFFAPPSPAATVPVAAAPTMSSSLGDLSTPSSSFSPSPASQGAPEATSAPSAQAASAASASAPSNPSSAGPSVSARSGQGVAASPAPQALDVGVVSARDLAPRSSFPGMRGQEDFVTREDPVTKEQYTELPAMVISQEPEPEQAVEAGFRNETAAMRSGPTPGSVRSAQEVGMDALNSSLASLASSYASPVSMQGNYGVQSEDTTSEDPDGGLPGGRTPDQTMAEQAATLGSLGNEQDGPGTNESTTTSDTTSPSGGGGDGNTPGTETTNYGEMGFGVFGGDGGQTGDTGDTSGGGRGGSGSVGGDVAGAAAAAAGLGSSPADGESTSGGPIADGGVVKPRMPKQYEEIIKRALRAARRSRAA